MTNACEMRSYSNHISRNWPEEYKHKLKTDESEDAHGRNPNVHERINEFLI